MRIILIQNIMSQPDLNVLALPNVTALPNIIACLNVTACSKILTSYNDTAGSCDLAIPNVTAMSRYIML